MIESADRVLRVLESFDPSERDVSLGELAERVALPKSSVHRLLATLIGHGLVERDPATRRYRLGIRLFELGSAAIHERGLHRAAHPALEQLSSSTGETCHRAVLSGTEAVYVYKLDGPSSIIMSSRVGGRAPCHATSIGKVLAAWGGEELIRALRAQPLRPCTPNTITTARAFEAELDRVREQGYALDLEEFEEGLRCVAAPVRDHSARVVAALGIAGPRRRFEDGHLDALVRIVVAAAGDLSRNLGYVDRHHQVTAVSAAG
ncbi:MAG TPA: IclR family transcriptional regulator [Candidatus Eisenbacteria bacterium]|nr:IclR family transcriptional regulator [Candidatus Eisenbacteria bacterium]